MGTITTAAMVATAVGMAGTVTVKTRLFEVSAGLVSR
jgi:hypothetical protein